MASINEVSSLAEVMQDVENGVRQGAVSVSSLTIYGDETGARFEVRRQDDGSYVLTEADCS